MKTCSFLDNPSWIERKMLRAMILALAVAVLTIHTSSCYDSYEDIADLLYSDVMTEEETPDSRTISTEYEIQTSRPTSGSQATELSTEGRYIEMSTESQSIADTSQPQAETTESNTPIQKDVLANALANLEANKQNINSYVLEISNGKVSLNDISVYDSLILSFIYSLREGGGLYTKVILLLLEDVMPENTGAFKDNVQNVFNFPESDVKNTLEYLNSIKINPCLPEYFLRSLHEFLENNHLIKSGLIDYGFSNGYAHAVAVLLLSRGLGKSINDRGDTLLHYAAAIGDVGSIQDLLDYGMDVNTKNEQGLTPLYFAAEKSHLVAAKKLVLKGADVDSKDENGDSLLHIAARRGDLTAAQVLIELGAAIDGDNDGITPLYRAAQYNNKELMSMLMDKGADIHHRKENGYQLIHLATLNNHTAAVENLLDSGVDIETGGNSGYTPLHVAARNGLDKMVRLLLRRGAMVDSTSDIGRTPLHEAAYWNYMVVVKTLISQGADPRYKDRYGHEPITMAEWQGNSEIIALLQEIDNNETILTTSTTNRPKFYVRI